MKRSALTTALIVLLGTSAPAAEKTSVAVLPIEGVNLGAAEDARWSELLHAALRRRGDLVTRAAREVSAALSSRPRSCMTEPLCLRDLGRAFGADKVFALRVGRLGDTLVLRLELLDARGGLRQGSWQEVLRASERPSPAEALDRLVSAAVPAPIPPPPRPWYRRWWVWAVAGAVVAGSVTAAVVVSQRRGDQPDYVVTPP